jgi:hypothetical protein
LFYVTVKMNIDTAEKWMTIVNNMLNNNPLIRCESYRLIREGITSGLKIFDPFTDYLAYCITKEYETVRISLNLFEFQIYLFTHGEIHALRHTSVSIVNGIEVAE